MTDRPTAPTPAEDRMTDAQQAARDWLERPCDGGGPLLSPSALDSSPRIKSLAALLTQREADLAAQVAALREALCATWPGIAEEEGYIPPGGNITITHRLAKAALASTAAAAEAHDAAIIERCARVAGLVGDDHLSGCDCAADIAAAIRAEGAT